MKKVVVSQVSLVSKVVSGVTSDIESFGPIPVSEGTARVRNFGKKKEV